MRKITIVFVMILAVLTMAACGGGDDDGREDPTTTGPAAETAPEASPSESSNTAAIDGTWVIDEVTEAEALEAIQAHGFGRDELRVFLGELGVTESYGLQLQLQGGSFSLFGSPDGAAPGGWDTGSTYTVEGDILTFVYGAGGSSTLRWTIEGDQLSLELLEDEQPPQSQGLPADIWVAGLYTAEPFTRVDP